jgi:hypothetical protein
MDLVMSCLCAIEKILNVSDLDQENSNASRVRECKGLKKLELLQFDDSIDICYKAAQIVWTYFNQRYGGEISVIRHHLRRMDDMEEKLV